MERTLSIQVLGATGSGKTKLLALISTLLTKEGVLIVGTTQETVCAESVQVKFDAEAHEESSNRILKGYEQMTVMFDDDSRLTMMLRSKTVELTGEAYTVRGHGEAHTFKVGFDGVVAITVS